MRVSKRAAAGWRAGGGTLGYVRFPPDAVSGRAAAYVT